MQVEVVFLDDSHEIVEVEEGSIMFIREQLDDLYGDRMYSHYLNVL